DAARLCNSGSSIADSPVPPRRRFVTLVVPAPPSATSETPDVTSVVSLNGFLPSKKAKSTRVYSLVGRVPSEPASHGASREFAARQLDGFPTRRTLTDRSRRTHRTI